MVRRVTDGLFYSRIRGLCHGHWTPTAGGLSLIGATVIVSNRVSSRDVDWLCVHGVN